ncbi:MAG: protein kinase [Deltaproteobacteria bacterium]|nr:protein kinase [Deltaproteobacteria bacterium]
MTITPAGSPGGEDRHAASRERGQPLPARFGRYLLAERLGEGGMADVYRAIAPGAAGVSKAVCIKRIRRGRLDDPRLVSLFIDEARVSMQLSHANIVHTYDFGRVGDEYFLALEYVDGVDLALLLDPSSPLGVEAVAAVGESLCRALSHVHSRKRPDGEPLGLVHRDVTPRNVLVTVEGDVKLADFGVARIPATRERIPSGRGEGLRGTPAYMAPEQASGGVVDSKSDLYAVGLVLYECLRGRPAYRGSREAVLDLARRGIVEIDAARSPLDAVLARAVQPDPCMRYPDAASMADDLGRIVARARAAGGGDPRATLAARVATRIRATGTEVQVDAPDDPRPASYYTEDGGAPDFALRLGATELSQAGTVPGGEDGARARRWPVPLLAGLVLILGGLSVLLLRGSAEPGPRAPAGGRPAPTPATVASEPPADAARGLEGPGAAPRPRDPGMPWHAGASGPPRRGGPDAPPSPVPSGTAILNLNALPWAEVTIDGAPRGTTPLAGLRLAAGRHKIRLRNEAMGITRSVVLTLGPDEHQTLVVDLHASQAPVDGGTGLASPGTGSSP